MYHRDEFDYRMSSRSPLEASTEYQLESKTRFLSNMTQYNSAEIIEADGEEEEKITNMIDIRQSAMLCLASLYIIITVIGFAANATVLYVIARSRRSKAVTSIYIFNLAIADLLYVVCLPAAVYPMLNGHWVLGHMMCKLYFMCDGVSKFASVMFLVVLSFDRYMAVCHPITTRAVRTAKVAFAASGASWLFVILAMGPVFVYATLVKVSSSGQDSLQCVIYWPNSAVGNETHYHEPVDQNENLAGNSNIQIEILAGNQSNDVDSNYDSYDNETNQGLYFLAAGTDWQRRIFTLYLFTLSFSVPLLMVWIFYIMILHRLWTQKRNMFLATSRSSNGKSDLDYRLSKSQRAMLPANRANRRRRRSTKRVTIMVLSIVVAYTLCWIPYWCVQMTIEFFREDPALDFEIFTIASYIAYGVQSINSALNPFLYAFGTHAHRRRLLQWLRRVQEHFGCKPSKCLGSQENQTENQLNVGQIKNGATVRYQGKMRVVDLTALAAAVDNVPNTKKQLLRKCSSVDDDVSRKFSSTSRILTTKRRSFSESSQNFKTAALPVHKSKNHINCFNCGDASATSRSDKSLDVDKGNSDKSDKSDKSFAFDRNDTLKVNGSYEFDNSDTDTSKFNGTIYKTDETDANDDLENGKINRSFFEIAMIDRSFDIEPRPIDETDRANQMEIFWYENRF